MFNFSHLFRTMFCVYIVCACERFSRENIALKTFNADDSKVK